MSTEKPGSYEIKRIGQNAETVRADSLEKTDENPPQYIFRKGGTSVLQIFVHALESEPKPNFPQTPEQKAKWRESVQRANAANQMPPNLER